LKPLIHGQPKETPPLDLDRQLAKCADEEARKLLVKRDGREGGRKLRKKRSIA